MLMTTLYWAPNNNPATSTYSMGGSGTWDASSFVWNTQADGHGTQRSWTGGGYGSPGTDAVFGSTAGTVMLTGNLYGGVTSLSFTADAYELEKSGSGALAQISISVDNNLTATVNALVSTGDLTKIGYGELVVENNVSFDDVSVDAGTLQLAGEHTVVNNITVDSGAYLCITGGVDIDNGAYAVVEGDIEVDGGALTLAGSGNGGIVMQNSGVINAFNDGQILVYGDFLNTDYGFIQPHDTGLFRLCSGATLTNQSNVYMGVYGSTGSDDGGKFQIDSGASVDNAGIIYVYSDGEIEINGDMTVAEGGTLEITNGGTGTVGEGGTLTLDGGQLKIGPNGEFTNAGDITLENDGSILIGADDEEFDDDAILTNSGTLNFNSGTVSIAGSTEDGEGIAKLENNGQMNLCSGASMTIEAKGWLEGMENGALNQSGGDFLVSEDGIFRATAVDVEDGTFDNEGSIVICNADLNVINAINDYGSNTGTVIIDAEVDLSGITLSGGSYEITADVTIDDGTIIDTDTTVSNIATITQDGSDWTQAHKIINHGYFKYGDLLLTRFHDDDSYLNGLTTVSVASAAASGTNGSPFAVGIDLDSNSTSGTLNQYGGSTNTFSLAYTASTHHLVFTVNGVSRDNYVDLGAAGVNTLVLRTFMDGINSANVGIKLKNLTFNTAPLGDESSAWTRSGGGSEALILTSTALQGNFTVAGEIESKYGVTGTSPEMNMSVMLAAGTPVPNAVVTQTANAGIVTWTVLANKSNIAIPSGQVSGDIIVTMRAGNNAWPGVPEGVNLPQGITIEPGTAPDTFKIRTANGTTIGTKTIRFKDPNDAANWCEIQIEVTGP